jgi:hypothetical protein
MGTMGNNTSLAVIEADALMDDTEKKLVKASTARIEEEDPQSFES